MSSKMCRSMPRIGGEGGMQKDNPKKRVSILNMATLQPFTRAGVQLRYRYLFLFFVKIRILNSNILYNMDKALLQVPTT